MRGPSTIAAIVAIVGSVLLASPAAATEPEVSAELDGVPIPIAEIPSYYCHDHDFPLIRCHASGSELEAALLADAAARLQGADAAAADYVAVYAAPSYAGAYTLISQDYDALVVIGWNDRIRSYRGLNSAKGTFYTDWFASGQLVNFCCNTRVPSLPSSTDHQFSSVYRR